MTAKRMGNHSKLVTKYGYFKHTPAKEWKLSRSWEGPYTVVKALSDAVYRIQKDGKDRKRVVVHFNRLKPCFANFQEPSQTRAKPKERRIPFVKVLPELTVQITIQPLKTTIQPTTIQPMKRKNWWYTVDDYS